MIIGYAYSVGCALLNSQTERDQGTEKLKMSNVNQMIDELYIEGLWKKQKSALDDDRDGNGRLGLHGTTFSTLAANECSAAQVYQSKEDPDLEEVLDFLEQKALEDLQDEFAHALAEEDWIDTQESIAAVEEKYLNSAASDKLERMASQNNFSDDESPGQSSSEEDSEWEGEESEWEGEDSEWEGEVADNTDSEEEDEGVEDDGLDKNAIIDGTRCRQSVQRFSEESKHLHPSFGGSAGANNGSTAGRKVDMGHSTENLDVLNAYAAVMRQDRT